VRIGWVERAALGLILALGVADVWHVSGPWGALLAGLAAVAHLIRWWMWQPWKTLRTPLVWVLHVAYVWIPVHLLLRTMAAMSWVAPSVAQHALTVGAIGGMVVGMMTRTSMGHTGRKLVAARSDVICYVLVSLAALVRVGMPLVSANLLPAAVLLSGVFWSGGFAIFVWRYWPILSRDW